MFSYGSIPVFVYLKVPLKEKEEKRKLFLLVKIEFYNFYDRHQDYRNYQGKAKDRKYQFKPHSL